MPQLEQIEAIEKRLWKAADNLRANSNYASNEYFMPVMGLVFLRHAYSRFLSVKESVVSSLPKRGGKTRPLSKEDFSQKGAIFLQPKAQFDHLVSLPDSSDRAKAIIEAMESIEADYESLRGVLPKSEYQELDNQVLGQLLRTLNPDELKKVKGDVFGRIYEYFLTQFADQKAHDGGEFFTPISLVSLIAHVLDPQRGTVLDPACGSGGMFVQSARIVEEQGSNPADRLTFRGLEKNATTIRLAKMNLAVHGLEGDIKKAITYYEDPHELVGKADYVMANPPFNVDEIDADKVKSDPRLPFGLPGVNKSGKVSNGNYIWISYFYSYLNDHGRAGFVMSSQASSAGGGEARVRQKLVETGDVEAMIDARNVYRKVTRKIYDFSPEQEQNLLAIVWLYRGRTDRYLDLVSSYCRRTLEAAAACFAAEDENGNTIQPLTEFTASLQPFLREAAKEADLQKELTEARAAFLADVEAFQKALAAEQTAWKTQKTDNGELKKAVDRLSPLAEARRNLVKQTDLLYKLAGPMTESGGREGTRTLKAADDARQRAALPLKQVRYFWKQAAWLTERFPEARLRDVEGLVKLASIEEIAANDWSLTPGRYVGVAHEEEDEDFDFEETLREIHVELEDLNAEAVRLTTVI
ncbi:MAG: class I SAM-dependent DNA methyltransferase, partial [Opitutaceae bacterium]